MDQNDKHTKAVIIYGLYRSAVQEQESGMNTQPQPCRPIIVLDPQRPGDRRQLARILAQIAWRLAKEQAAQDVVSSQEHSAA
jgi:hypothetical protein